MTEELTGERKLEGIRDRYIEVMAPLFFPDDPIGHDIIRYFASLLRVLDDRFHETSGHGTSGEFVDSSFSGGRTRNGIMARWRQVIELAMSEEEIASLAVLSRSRTEPASRVARAQMLLAYHENPSFFAVGRQLSVHHQT